MMLLSTEIVNTHSNYSMSAADEDITSWETSIQASRIISMISLVTLTNHA